MKNPLATLIAVLSGLLVLLGYFFPLGPLAVVRDTMLQWAVLLAAFALLVGVFYLWQVHWRKIRAQAEGRGYSLLLLVTLTASFALTLVQGLGGQGVQWVLDYLILPVAVSLMAVLAVTLLVAASRLLRRRHKLLAVLFLFAALFALLGLGALPGSGTIPLIGDTLRPWIAQVPAAAGARGILIGVALGVLLTGLRVLLGVDDPYRD